VLKGIVVPMVTPFKEDYSLDLEAVKWLARYLERAGVDALFPNSTTGEFPHLTAGEAMELVKSVIEVVKSSTTVAPGVSANTTLHSIELAKRFRDLGAEVVISTTPYYFKPGEEGIYRHFALIAESVDINLVLYCIPSTTGVLIPVSVVKRLAKEYSNVVGIKVTHDSLEYLRALINEVKGVRKDFSVLVGIDTMLLHGLIEGCDGGVVGLANVAPWIHKALYDAWRGGGFAKALGEHARLCRLFSVYSVGKPAPSVVKGALEAIGAPVKRVVRPPLQPLSDEELGFVKGILSGLGVLEEARKFFP